MKYLVLLCATALFYYLIGAFIYSSFNSALWSHEGKVGLSSFYGMTLIILLGTSLIVDESDNKK